MPYKKIQIKNGTETPFESVADVAIKDSKGRNIVATYATQSELSDKQDELDTDQLAAVNSGIDSDKVEQYDSWGVTLDKKLNIHEDSGIHLYGHDGENQRGYDLAQSITGDNDKVPSSLAVQNALADKQPNITTENKLDWDKVNHPDFPSSYFTKADADNYYQPIGNYQPVGRYVSISTDASGNDIAEIQQGGKKTATIRVSNVNDTSAELTSDAQIITKKGGLTTYTATLPLKTGTLAMTSDIPNETTVTNWGFTKNTGTVRSVNDIGPVNGNVTIAIPPEVTQSTVSGWGFITSTQVAETYATQLQVNQKQDKISIIDLRSL